jgi:hypothetical protein
MFWLDCHKPEVQTIDPSAESRKTEGNEVGDLAMGYFGDYTEVTTLKADGSLDYSAMIAKTKKLIAAGADNICEAAFCNDEKGIYCAVDILHKQGGGYAIYEVKSVDKDISEMVSQKDKQNKKVMYFADVAFQKYVLESCGIVVTGTYLITLNKNYVRHGDIDIKQLFKVDDISSYVDDESPFIEGNLAKANEMFNKADEPTDIPLGNYCFHPYDCAYWEYCTKDLPKPNVFELANFKKKLECYNQGLVSFKDLVDSGQITNERQLMQIDYALHDKGTYINKDGIKSFLNKLYYPLYFLDFETTLDAIPQFDFAKPYEKIPFQYSLHYIESKGGKLNHKEFLGESGKDNRLAIAKRLIADIPANACVIAFSMGFERSRIAAMADLFPKLKHDLMCIHDNMVDIAEVFSAGYYYNRAMVGRYSIKYVLPAVFPDEPELNYKNLDGVHNGDEAMNIFPKIKDMPPAEQEKTRRELLAYCGLDTLAMVKLWQELVKVCKE